jgi:hypothetical protein
VDCMLATIVFDTLLIALGKGKEKEESLTWRIRRHQHIIEAHGHIVFRLQNAVAILYELPPGLR